MRTRVAVTCGVSDSVDDWLTERVCEGWSSADDVWLPEEVRVTVGRWVMVGVAEAVPVGRSLPDQVSLPVIVTGSTVGVLVLVAVSVTPMCEIVWEWVWVGFGAGV